MRRASIAEMLKVWLVAVFLCGIAFAAKAGELGTLQWQGQERSYLLFVPPGAGDKPLPLVIAFHGAGGNAADFSEETGLAKPGAAHGMLVAFADGTERTPGRRVWNARFCCGGDAVQRVDDIGFAGALIDRIARERPIDRKRVFATGMSNGGMLAYQLAAAHPEWFAAIAPVSAAIGGTMRDGQVFVIGVPKLPVSVEIIHGRKDSYVMYGGGSSPNLKFPNRWKLSVADAVSFWAAADGCPPTAESDDAVHGVLERVAYRGCGQGSEVVLWRIMEGDHNWPPNVFPLAQRPAAFGRGGDHRFFSPRMAGSDGNADGCTRT